MKKSKTYSIKDLRSRFVYTLQFYRDKHGTLCLDETANRGSLEDVMSMMVFGSRLAESPLLSYEDKLSFLRFCKSFIHKFEETK